MTITKIPNFISSPYFVMEFGNWHLKPAAPPEVVKEFTEWMKDYDETPVGKDAKKNKSTNPQERD